MPPQPGTEGSSWAKAGTAVSTVSAAMSIATHRTKKIRLISLSPPFSYLRRRCCPQTTELSRVVRGVKELAPTHWEATVATTYSITDKSSSRKLSFRHLPSSETEEA